MTLITAVTLSLASFQVAQAKVDPKATFVIKAIMRLLDTNKNQQLEFDEIKKRWNQAFVMTDKNADKVLTLDEFQTLFTARSAQIKMLDPKSKLPSIEAAFKALDNNKNKQVSGWEFSQHAKIRFRQVDTNKNKKISLDEMLAVRGRLSL